MSDERWEDIRGYQGRYQVNRQGQVRRLPYQIVRRSSRHRCETHVVYPMRAVRVRAVAGVASVYLRDSDGKPHVVAVKQLVARAFLDYPSDTTPIIRHRDGDRMNCWADNLTFQTDTTDEIGPGWRRLTDEQVTEIRRLSHEGIRHVELARRFHRTPGAISKIVRGTRYGQS